MTQIDIILNILERLRVARPGNAFISSLHQQYCNRGGLSKKQLEGLYGKAAQSGVIATAQLATLEAIIKKKPTRYKSEKIQTLNKPEIENDTEHLLQLILEKYPQHKMALFLKAKNKDVNSLTISEKNELQRLAKVLLKQIDQ